MKLRSYQLEALGNVHAAYNDGKRSVLVVLCTGGGKTVLAAHLIKEFVSRGRIMVIAHREELINQAARTIDQITGICPAIEMGSQRADMGLRADPRIVVGTIQTQIAGRQGMGRMTRFPPEQFSLVWIDEAHHIPAESYRRVLDYYMRNPDLKVFGCTATPDRTDEAALGQIFDHCAFRYDILDGINDGWLVPIRVAVEPVVSLDFSKVRTTAGDLNAKDLAAIMEAEENLHPIANGALRICGNEPALIFTSSVAHATMLAEILNRHKPDSARCISAKTPDEARRESLADYAAGRFQFMVNCGIFLEGYDAPWIRHVVMARPTKSRSLYVQMCLDGATEILTDRGWRGIDDKIEAGEQAAAFDMSDGSIRWSPILNEVRRSMQPIESWRGISNPHLDIKITDGHDIITRRRVTRKRTRSAWTKTIARDFTGQGEIPVCGLQAAPGVPLTDDELRFIGLFMTDGSHNPLNNAITIYQSERYPIAIEYIERTLFGCGFKFGHLSAMTSANYGERRHKMHRWTVSHGMPRGRDKDKRGWAALLPYLHKDLSENLEGMTREQLLVLIEAMEVGDGVKSRPADHLRGVIAICTSRTTMSNRLQSLCVRRGIRCNIGVAGTNGGMDMLRIHPDQPAWHIVSHSADRRPTFGEIKEAQGLVWCIEVSTGAIVTRRNGKVAILGNCGRGTRPLPGVVDGPETADERKAAIAFSDKPHLTILDFVGNSGSHKLICAIDALGGRSTPREIEIAMRQAGQQPGDITEMLARARESEEKRRREEEERKAKRAAEAERRRHVRAETVDVRVNYIDPFNVLDRTPPREYPGNAGRRATEPQIACLEKWGVDEPRKLSFDQARTLMDELIGRMKRGEATYKQCKLLKKRGLPTDGLTKAQATEWINAIVNNGWKLTPELQTIKERQTEEAFT